VQAIIYSITKILLIYSGFEMFFTSITLSKWTTVIH